MLPLRLITARPPAKPELRLVVRRRRRSPPRSSRLAQAVASGARPHQHAGQRPRARRSWKRPPATSPQTHGAACAPSPATICWRSNFPMIHAVGRASPARAAADRLAPGAMPIASQGHPGRQGRRASTPAGSTSSPTRGMLLMKKDMGGAATALALRRDDHGRRAAGPAARPDPGGRERDLRLRLPARRRARQPQGPDRRDRQHRRGGPPDPRRRAGAGRRGDARSR